MKKILYLMITALTIGTVMACGGNASNDEAEKELSFESVVRDTTVKLSNDPSSPQAEIHLNILYATGKNAATVNDTLLRSGILTPDYLSASGSKMDAVEAIDSFIIKYAADYKQDFGRLYAADKEHATSYSLQYSCNTKADDGRKGIINYIAEVYSYAGGAHGINMTIAKNINKESGKILKLSDVFVPGHEQTLKELIVEKLCKQYDAKDLKGLQEKGLFVNMDPYVSENFILQDDNIVFIYCDSEIAPHAVGEIKVEIDDSDLKQILVK
jgi:hypothetical protein